MSKAALQSKHAPPDYRCGHCETEIPDSDKVLFVEEEVGRVFCSESCIVSYFAPDIERLEKRYFDHLRPTDLSVEERENLAHLRWSTLKEPKETWAQKTVAGDRRFTLVSEFTHERQKVWCVCISLFLRGEPSFLYLAFVSRDERLVDAFREGERADDAFKGQQRKSETGGAMKKQEIAGDQVVEETVMEDEGAEPPMLDCLADPWTEDETIRAELLGKRKDTDIPRTVFHDFEACVATALEQPDQVWSLEIDREGRRMFHFIKNFAAGESPVSSEARAFWYVLIARETGEPDQIEILDAFPTVDTSLVDMYRQGVREIDGKPDQEAAVEQVEGDAGDEGPAEEEESSGGEPRLKIVH